VTETEDLRTFIREITLRFERGMERISREIREDSRRYFEGLDAQQRARDAEQRARDAEQRARNEENREKLDEILAEGRAGRQALFRMLDKLDGGGAAPAG
jgi:IS30 family transposase